MKHAQKYDHPHDMYSTYYHTTNNFPICVIKFDSNRTDINQWFYKFYWHAHLDDIQVATSKFLQYMTLYSPTINKTQYELQLSTKYVCKIFLCKFDT